MSFCPGRRVLSMDVDQTFVFYAFWLEWMCTAITKDSTEDRMMSRTRVLVLEVWCRWVRYLFLDDDDSLINRTGTICRFPWGEEEEVSNHVHVGQRVRMRTMTIFYECMHIRTQVQPSRQTWVRYVISNCIGIRQRRTRWITKKS